MSDHNGKLNNDVSLGANRPVEPFQSVLTVHQTQTSHREARHVSNGLESQNDHVANKHSSIGRLEEDANLSDSIDFAEVTEARTVRIMKKGVVANSETLIHERFGRQGHSIFNLRQNFKIGDGKNELNLSSLGRVARSQVNCNGEYNAHRAPDSPLLTMSKVSQNNNEIVLYDGLARAGPSRDKFAASNQMVHRINMGKLPELSSVGKSKMHTQLGCGVESKEDIASSSFAVSGQEHHGYRSSTFSVSREKGVDRQSTSKNYEGSFLKQVYTPLPLQDPFYGNNNSLEDDEEQYQKIHGFSGNGIFPSQSRISCNPNFLDGSAGGAASVPQRTNNLLIMEETDCNSSKKSHAFWESTNHVNVKRSTSTKLLAFPSGIGQRGVEFRPPDIITDTVEKDRDNNKSPENLLENESFADTNTMDIGDLKEQTDFSGINSSPSTKMALNPPSQVEKASVGEATKCRRTINTLPDINEEIPLHQSALGLKNDAIVSSSRTLSMDTEHLIFPRHEMKRKSRDSSGTPVETDPSSRWLKRLRLGANVEETSYHKELLVQGKTGGVSENRGSLLSETWIKRWCCNEANPQKQPQVVVTSCEPQSSNKEESDKQFPSFAAMALMGRAMTGFRPFEFRSRGPFVVWNTNDF